MRIQYYQQLLNQWLQDEAENIFVFIPLVLALGIISYFALPHEPTITLSLSITFSMLLLLYIAKSINKLTKSCLLITTLCLGFSIAHLNTYVTDTYLLSAETDNMTIIGEVEQIQHLDKGNRLWIKNIKSKYPDIKRIRLNVKTDVYNVHIGDVIKIKAVLLPPPLPMVPEGFNFARYSFFKGINAIGYATSQPVIIDSGLKHSIWYFFGNLRDKVTIRIHQLLPQPLSGIAVGVLVGDASSIPQTDYQIIKASGISHLLAISGMHMVIVVAILFISTRFLLLRSEYLSLRVNVKKVAAIVALIGSFLYLMLALMPVSAQRAFIMSSIVLLGIILDKNSTSIRAVTIGAILILVITPYEILNPSLQMSFAASVALVVSYTFFDKILPFNRVTSVTRILYYFLSIALSTFIAGIATAPFIIFHFHEYSTYSILTNLLAIPINDFIVMPLGLLALLCMPFHLDWLPLKLMSYGIELIYKIAYFVSTLKFATFPALSISPIGIAILSFCGFAFMLCKTYLRFFTLLPCLIIFVMPGTNLKPDILVEQQGKLFAIRYEGNLYYSNYRKARFIRNLWQTNFTTQSSSFKLAELNDKDCNQNFCSFRKDNHRVAIIANQNHVKQDLCSQYDLLVNLTAENLRCDGKIITLNDLQKLGNLSIWVNQDGVKYLGAQENLAARPWLQPQSLD